MSDFEINDRVILDTEIYGSIEAAIDGYDDGKNRYKLRDIVVIETGRALSGTRYLYSSNIKSGSVLQANPIENGDDSGTGSMESSSDSSSNDGTLEGTTINDLEALKDLTKTYRFVENHDRCYKIALKDLNEQEYIGLIAEDAEFRTQKLHTIAMSTPDHIYIFDILSLGKMPADMVDLLESKTVKKITANSDRLGDCLKYHYDVNLDGVFDVQLADAYITKIKSGIYPSTLLTYEQCVSKYLKIPAHVYIKKPTLQQNGAIRPLSDAFKSQLAQNISFLQNLSMKLYNNIMTPFYAACNYRMNLIREEKDNYEAGIKINDNVTDDLVTAFDAHEIE